MTFHEAIRSKNFTEALAMVQRGDDLLISEFTFQLSDSFAPLLQGEAYDVVNGMIDAEAFSLDTFDYDSFDRTIFKAVVENLKKTSEAEKFLTSFVGKIEGLNDSLGGKTFLSLAVESLFWSNFVQIMVDNGCDTSYLDRGDSNYLHVLANSNPHIGDQDNLMALIQLFIDQGLDIDAEDLNGNTPLFLAVSQKLLAGAELLLNAGADPTLKNKKNESPLSMAQKYAEYGDSTILELLSQYGDTDEDDRIVQCYQTISRIENGEPLTPPSDSELCSVEPFAGVNIYLPIQDSWGNETTIASEISKKGSHWFEKFIEVFGIDPTYIDDFGDTILHKVCAVDVNFEEKKAKALVQIAKILIKMGADPTIRNNEDKSAIDLASDSNYKEKLVVLLLRASK